MKKYRVHELGKFRYSDIGEYIDENHTDRPLRNDELVDLLNNQDKTIKELSEENEQLKKDNEHIETCFKMADSTYHMLQKQYHNRESAISKYRKENERLKKENNKLKHSTGIE